MESLGKIIKVTGKSKDTKIKVNTHLHSPAHLLADELCRILNDKKHFGFYLKMATLYNHDWLRKLAAEVMENQNVKTPGRLFAYLIKKHNEENANVKNQDEE